MIQDALSPLHVLSLHAESLLALFSGGGYAPPCLVAMPEDSAILEKGLPDYPIGIHFPNGLPLPNTYCITHLCQTATT